VSQRTDLSLRRGRVGIAVLVFGLVLAATAAAAHALGPDPGPTAAASHALHPDSYEPAPEITAPPPAPPPTVTVRTVTVPATTTSTSPPPAPPTVPPQHLTPSSEPTVSPVRTQPVNRVASPPKPRPTPKKHSPAPVRLYVPAAHGSLVYVAAEQARRLEPELAHLASASTGLDRRLVTLAALALLTLVAASATFLRLAVRVVRP
jgi:hypothetical protein